MYEFNEPFIVDHSKFEKVFGDISTPHREAVRKTLQWFKAAGRREKASMALEIKVIRDCTWKARELKSAV